MSKDFWQNIKTNTTRLKISKKIAKLLNNDYSEESIAKAFHNVRSSNECDKIVNIL